MPRFFQFPPNFPVVIDFTVEDDSRAAIVAQEWLVSAPEVDNLQAHGTERRHAAFEYSLLIGTAMRDGFGDAMGHGPAHRPVETCKPGDSTHLRQFPVPREETPLYPFYDGFA